jgi:acyl-coenzyme A thioesterase PaaI-like protein
MSVTTKRPDTPAHSNGHSRCLLCGSLNPRSLNLSFQAAADGAVRTSFQAHDELQGYDRILHGGVIAALLDGAMTHCLFHQQVKAVTGDLRVRFVHSIPCDALLDIRARILYSRPPLYRLKAEIAQDGRLMAWAEARFMEQGGRHVFG